jgi:hypothetical protein
MDTGSIGSFGSYLRVAAVSSEVILHQTKVDLRWVLLDMRDNEL